jgi:hypothetical protein
MLSSAIKGGLQTYNFFSNLFNLKMSGPNSDVFANLLSPTTQNDISSYVTSYFQFSLLSKQTLFYLQSQLRVTAIGLNKAGSPVEHESLAVWVQDTLTFQSHKFVIERMPSKVARSRFSAFSQFPDSDAVLESILKAVHNQYFTVPHPFQLEFQGILWKHWNSRFPNVSLEFQVCFQMFPPP